MESKESPTLSSWVLFEEELHTYFGDPDEVATQEHKLRMLKMNNHHCVLHYINQFKEVASLTKWNDDTLCSQFYQGLPSRLQDDILWDGKPAKLQGMYQAALKFDGCYWECQEELKAMRTSNHSTQASSSCGANPPSSSTSPSSSTNPPHNPKIYKLTGGLTEEEKERHKHKKLCAYCTQSDHTVDNCPNCRGPPWTPVTPAVMPATTNNTTTTSMSCNPVACTTFTISRGASTTPDEPHITKVPLSEGAVHLHTTISSLSPSSFITTVSIPLLSDTPVSALIDCGASENFIDAARVQNLRATPHHHCLVTPCPLWLFDGSIANDLDHIVMLPVTFVDGLWQHIEFIESQLHPSTPVILGLPWLRQANPQISWANMHIEHMGYHLDLVTTPLSVDIVTVVASTLDTTPKIPSAHTITIEAYEAKDFIKEVSEDGTILFTCVLANPIQAHATTVVHDAPSTSVLPDSIPETEWQALMMQLPEEYHKFHNVFTGTTAS
jgi:Retrotransposon gag protein